MKLTGKVLGAAVAASIAAIAPAAADATVISYTTNPGVGAFSDSYTFSSPTGASLSVYLGSILSGPKTDVNFTSAKLNGASLSVISTGSSELRQLLDIPIAANEIVTLVVNGSSQLYGSYSVTFATAGAVPETATWALMVLGFGAVGYAMRRRVAKTTVAFA